MPGVKPLDSDVTKKINEKSQAVLEDGKSIDLKKKISDFAKPKSEYKKSLLKDSRAANDAEVSTTPSETATAASVAEESTTPSTAEKKLAGMLPLLVRGEPIVLTELTTENSVATESEKKQEDSASTTMATTMAELSSRARALNVSAPEPGNTLHANVTDLSDVSMDEEDKEVEGRP